MNIAIVGCGNIGTQFAVHCAHKQHRVTIYCSKPEVVSKTLTIVNSEGEQLLTDDIYLATKDASLAFSDADLIFVTVPAFAMNDYAQKIIPFLKRGAMICLTPGTGGAEFAFKDALICLENCLCVGYSPESSVRESVKSLEQLHGRNHDICREFRIMVKQMELGIGMEAVFSDFGKRTGVTDIKQLADIFAVAKRTGGNLSQVLRQTGSVLQDKIELKRELHTAIAAKRMEFRIMCAVPYGILLYLKLCAPSMSRTLYHNTFGILFMWGILAVYLGLTFLGERIIRGETEKVEA